MFHKYKTDPVYKAHVELWGLAGVLLFLLLVAAAFLFENSHWLLTAGVLLVSLFAVNLVFRFVSNKNSISGTAIATVVITTVITIALSEYVSPEKTIQQHFSSLLNPSWLILVFALLGIKKSLS